MPYEDLHRRAEKKKDRRVVFGVRNRPPKKLGVWRGGIQRPNHQERMRTILFYSGDLIRFECATVQVMRIRTKTNENERVLTNVFVSTQIRVPTKRGQEHSDPILSPSFGRLAWRVPRTPLGTFHRSGLGKACRKAHS